MKNKNGIALGFFLIIIILLIGSFAFKQIREKNNTPKEDKWMKNVEKYKKQEMKIRDNKEIYEDFQGEGVEELYVTVLPPDDNSVTFTELNADVNKTNDVYSNEKEDKQVKIYFSTKPESEKDKIANATMEIKGQSSRLMEQKSYKIKLTDEKMNWQGMKILNLNKHFSDSLRVKNKLSFDYMKEIDNITSYRTKFIKLNIKDMSSGENKDYTSYGLYTFIEQPNKSYLRDHKLDPSGYLYKAEFFEFFRDEDNIRAKDDPLYNEQAFESILESKGNDNHKKLIEMLDAVNDYNIDIDEVVKKYFDKDNMLTWLAINILMNNYDTSSRNFLLYSPINNNKWFFIPWDYDSSWVTYYKPEESWQFGIANYWGSVLFNRYFKKIDNVNALSNKIEEIYKIITKEKTLSLVDKYDKSIEDIIYSMPDSEYIKKPTKENYKKELEYLSNIPEINKERYYKDIERPLPFFLWEAKEEEGKLEFNWQQSFDFQEDDITYEFILSKDIQFKDIVAEVKDLKDPICKIDKVQSGDYFWRVIAYDSHGNWRYPFDYTDNNWGYKKVHIN